MAKRSTNPNKKAADIFGGVKGEQFGGKSNYLQLAVGEVVHGFVHIRIEKNVKLDKDNDAVDLHVGLDPRTGEEIRMPAAAVFRKNIEAAKLNAGDVYSVARLADAIKKAGKGKNKPMAVYSLLVTKRLEKKGKK